MPKILFKIFAGCLLTAVVATIVSVILPWAVLFVMSMIGKEPAPITLIIVAAATSAVVSAFWLIGASAIKWFNWMFCGEKACVKHPPHAAIGMPLVIFAPLALGGCAAWLGWTYYGEIVSVIESSQNFHYFTLLFLPPALTVSQICCLFAVAIHYGVWQICPRCGRMFCIGHSLTEYRDVTDTKYKKKTRKEKVGSISYKGKKIADVEANVTRIQKETTNTEYEDFKGYCTHCGREHRKGSKISIG